MSNKTRLDVLLVERGLQESRQKAQATIMSGLVFADGRRVPPFPMTRRSRSGEMRCSMSAGAD